MLSKQQVNALRANRQVTRAVQVMVFVAVASVAALSIASVNQAFPSPPDAPAGALQGARYLQSQSSPGVVVPKKTTIRGPGSVAQQPSVEMMASQPLIPPKGGSLESVRNAFKQLPFNEVEDHAAQSSENAEMASQPLIIPAKDAVMVDKVLGQHILARGSKNNAVIWDTFKVHQVGDVYSFQVVDGKRAGQYLTDMPEKRAVKFGKQEKFFKATRVVGTDNWRVDMPAVVAPPRLAEVVEDNPMIIGGKMPPKTTPLELSASEPMMPPKDEWQDQRILIRGKPYFSTAFTVHKQNELYSFKVTTKFSDNLDRFLAGVSPITFGDAEKFFQATQDADGYWQVGSEADPALSQMPFISASP
jgi:hypothetical protein